MFSQITEEIKNCFQNKTSGKKKLKISKEKEEMDLKTSEKVILKK